RIPTAYMRHFNGDVPKKFILTSPTKRSWMVSTKEIGNDVFLCDEWRSFVKDHALEFGDFLVFRYNGKSEFSVSIFGIDACEKEVPLATKDNVESISHLEDKKEVNEMGSPDKLHSGILDTCTEEKRNDEAVVMDKMSSLPDSKTKSAERTEKLEATNSFTVTFVLSKKYRIGIPRGLAREKGLRQKDTVVLLDPCGRSWPVTIRRRRDIETTTMTSGWANFRLANNINIGDTCRFEFIEGLGDALRVYIFRTSIKAPSEKQATACTTVSTYTRKEETEAAKRKGPRELVNDRATKYIKQERCTRFGLNFNKMDDGDHLDSGCSSNYSTLPNLTLPEPIGGNPHQRKNTEVPQELPSSIPYSGVISNVSKTKTSKSPKTISGRIKKKPRRTPLEPMPSRHVAAQEKERNIATGASTSNKPFCSVTLRPTYVGSRSQALVLPTLFAKKYMKHAPRSVTLQDINGATWHAQYRVGAHHKLVTGWNAFVLDNNLKEDDVCNFELVNKNRNHYELKVSIDRS
ncbi:AP2/B3-like transcriptional factor family protein, partial [Thalictrum thalictroides]